MAKRGESAGVNPTEQGRGLAKKAVAADTSTPAPTIARTVDEERERAITAAFERAKSSFDAAQQSGEGFLLKGTIATSIGTLKKKHGVEAVSDLLQRLEQAGVQDIDISKAGEGESERDEIKIEDIGALENGLKPGEESLGLDLHYDSKAEKWVLVERKKTENKEIQQEAASAYQDVLSAVQNNVEWDYFEDSDQRRAFLDRIQQLKKELSAMRVNLVIDQSGTKISTTLGEKEWSEEVSKKQDVRPSMAQKAKAQLRKEIISSLANDIISELQGLLAKKMGDFKSKARSADWKNFQTGYGQTEGGHTTIILRGAVQIGDRTIQLGSDREYTIEYLAGLAGKKAAAISGDDVIAFAKGKVLVELASSEPSLAEAIKALSTTQEPASRPDATASGARDAGRATSPSAAKTRRESSDDRERPLREEPRRPAPEPRATPTTDAERLALMQQELNKLNVRIAALNGEKAEVEKGSKEMEDIAWSQTSLLLERRGLLERMARLQSDKKPGAAAIGGEERSAPRKEAGGPTTPAKPEPTLGPEVAAAPALAPKPEPASPPAPAAEPAEAEKPELNDQKRQELRKQFEQIEKDLGVRRKKVADLQARDETTAKAKKGKPVKNTKLDYEKGQVDKLEARQAALRKQLGLEATSSASLPMAAEKPLTDEERQAILEQAKKDLPTLVREGLHIVAQSVANARMHADKLLDYGEEKVGTPRAEAIDNAIEIINAAEKERSKIASALETTTDIAQLQILVSRSSEMALRGAMAAHRLEGLLKEVDSEYKKSNAAETPTELDARIQEVQKIISANTESIRTLRESVDHTNKTLRQIGRDEGKRKLFLEESSQLHDDLKKKEDELRRNQERLADLMRQRAELLSAPAADAIEPEEGHTQPDAGQEPVEIPETVKAMAEPQLRETIDAIMAQLASHYSAGQTLIDIVPSDKYEQGRHLLEELKNNADLGTVWTDLLTDEKPTREELLGIYGNSQASLRDSMNTLDELKNLVASQGVGASRPPLKAGATRAVTADRVPEGMFDDPGADGILTHGGLETAAAAGEESPVEKAERIADANFYTASWDDNRVTVSFAFIPPGKTERVNASYTISREDIAQHLTGDLRDSVNEHGFLYDAVRDNSDVLFEAAQVCVAEKLLKRIESGKIPENTEYSDRMRENIYINLDAIGKLRNSHQELLTDANEDIDYLQDLQRKGALHSETISNLNKLIDSLNDNELGIVQFYWRLTNDVLTNEETDIESQYFIIEKNRFMLASALKSREEIFANIRRMRLAEAAALTFLQEPTGPLPGEGVSSTFETAHTRPGLAVDDTSLLGGAREHLQIGTGEAIQELSPEETQEILVELAGLRGELAKLDQQETLLLQLLAQLDLEENTNQ